MALGFAGCSDDNPALPSGGETGDAVCFLHLNVAVTSPGSRASEINEVLEPGVRHENDIEELTLFFFNDPDLKGFDALCAADSAFAHIESVMVPLSPNSDRTQYVGIVPLMKRPAEGQRIIAVANAQGLGAVKTLRDLSAHIAARAWQVADNIADCDRFVMSTASTASDEGVVEVAGHTGKQENPFRVKLNIERTAARIDFWFNSGDVSSNRKEVVYDVVTPKSENVAKFHLTHMAPVNVMRESTYTLKRASKAESPLNFADFATCGKEWEGADGRPVNYIIEPHTAFKATDSGYDTDKWYRTTAADYIRENPTAVFTASTALSGPLQQTAIQGDYTQSGNRANKYVPLCYANENTQLTGQHDSRFITGLALRGVYEPRRVYTDAAATQLDTRSYAEGRDFWRYSPTAKEMDEGESIYFSNYAAAQAYADANPGDRAEIVPYAGGVCYYNVWIRHHGASTAATDDPHRTYPMEYAIVRNHIYRVSVSFSGPGQPTPRVREPENVISRIFVRIWNVITTDGIIL